MNETKLCPYCGQEIMATAKKCKHCGKWLEKKCTKCGEWINIDAKKCKHCGCWLNKFSRQLYEYEQGIQSPGQSEMQSREEIRDAIEQDKEDSGARTLLNIEAFIFFGIMFLGYDWDWWESLIAYIICFGMLGIRILRAIFCIVMSLAWGLLAVVLSPALFDSESVAAARYLADDYGSYWWLGLVVTVCALFFHGPAMRKGFDF